MKNKKRRKGDIGTCSHYINILIDYLSLKRLLNIPKTVTLHLLFLS